MVFKVDEIHVLRKRLSKTLHQIIVFLNSSITNITLQVLHHIHILSVIICISFTFNDVPLKVLSVYRQFFQ